MKNTISFDDFLKVDIRSGKIVKSEVFDRARKPAYKVWVDFGSDIGILQTSAQITVNYSTEELIGKIVMGCINLGEKNIAGFLSQFLLLGFEDEDGNIVLACTNKEVPVGKSLM
jgi:tRNA-binding protein